MPLNKVSGNMYNWITDSFNPLGGACPHKCSYCYAQNFRFPSLKKKYSGPPRLYENELKRKLGKDKFWFVGSCIDLFAREIPTGWIYKTLEHCNCFDNRYLFQSKNPIRFLKMKAHLPDKVILGTTIESDIRCAEMGETPNVRDRARAMWTLKYAGFKTIVTIEPIMKFNLFLMLNLIDIARPDWVNIGANTNTKVKLPEPEPEKVMELIERLKEITEVKIKPNLKRLMT